MWVHETHRGTTVGTELVDFIASWAAARGATGLLAGVTEGNDRALRFYAKIGFLPYDGEIDPEMDGCETVLWKRLPPDTILRT
jgi:GNAT superfamily N-acetyltransferase